MKTAYQLAVERLMAQYDEAWERAEAEEAETGTVSEETDSLLCIIEMELQMLSNAV